MPNNTDISPLLTEEMKLERELNGGALLYTLPVRAGNNLYRSMTFGEARDWLNNEDEEWLPPESGIPWSTNVDYSRDNYLRGGSTVQLEVPVGTILERFQAMGLGPKPEGGADRNGKDSGTWGTGPVNELSFKASSLGKANIVETFNKPTNSFNIVGSEAFQRTIEYGPGSSSFGSTLRGELGNFTGLTKRQSLSDLTWALNSDNVKLKKLTSLMFRTLFKQQIHNARVVARVFPV